MAIEIFISITTAFGASFLLVVALDFVSYLFKKSPKSSYFSKIEWTLAFFILVALIDFLILNYLKFYLN